MELVAFLRTLARHRVAVLAGLVLSIAAGVAMLKLGGHSKPVAHASGRVLLATPNATASDTDSKIADTLPGRATLLADLMSTNGAASSIAHDAHVSPSQIAVRVPAMGMTQLAVPLPVAAEQAALPSGTYLLHVTTQDPTTGNQVPIIGIAVTGPDLATAKRLVDAARKQMQTAVSTGSKRGPAVIVEPLGPARGQVLTAAKSKALPVAAAVLMFGFWCSAIIVTAGLARRARARRRHAQVTRALQARV
jgi:hypothetical protein